ncbi:hypothetical protein SB2_06710 [Methylobacterium radiotolerans]|nr:hypothetical protein SB3_08755 [Methylobacterium radiotolerans]KTS49245.1 hypothetical protein SB2_06710 [Methylobacterium radiotolerans]
MDTDLNLGPSFPSELAAAGLLGKPFAFGLGSPGYVLPDPSMSSADLATLKKVMADHDPSKPAPVIPPDCLSLPWWRTALKLWIRTDSSGAQTARYADVDAAIKVLETATDVPTQRAGILAREQFEYASTVLRDDLLKLAPAFKFTPADVDESLWRADRVRQGDLTGAWPQATTR